MKLAELQAALQDYLLGSELVSSCFVTPTGRNSTERLDIYRRAYFQRLFEILKSDYEALSLHLGEKTFYSLIESYLKHYPSCYVSIREVGARLAHFISIQYPEHPDWAELADFEWKLNEVLFSDEAKALSLEDLKSIEWDQWPLLIFKLHPSVRLFSCQYNIPESWHALMNREPYQFQQRSERQHYLVWCKQRQSFFCSLSPDEKLIWDALQMQKSFAELCEFVGEHQSVDSISQSLQAWINNEILIL